MKLKTQVIRVCEKWQALAYLEEDRRCSGSLERFHASGEPHGVPADRGHGAEPTIVPAYTPSNPHPGALHVIHPVICLAERLRVALKKTQKYHE